MALNKLYASLDDIKAALRITDNVDDTLLSGSLESASRLIDGYCGRFFYNAGTATKTFSPNSYNHVWVNDLQSVTTIKVSTYQIGLFDATLAATDYQLEPLNGEASGIQTPYTSIRAIGNYSFPEFGEIASVEVTGTWGWSEIPGTIQTATVIQASRLFKRLDTPLGVAGFGDMGAVRVGRGLDGDVAQLCDPYRLRRELA